jgi:hypothetical protein
MSEERAHPRKKCNPGITKSEFTEGSRCSKSFWLARNRASIFGEAAGKGGISADKQMIFDNGNEVGAWAKKYFPGGVEVDEKEFRDEKRARLTKQLIEAGHEVIFEATAINPADKTRCRIDILRRVPGMDEWDLIEVKGSAEVKDYHKRDIAMQRHVFEGAGYKIRHCELMHINGDFVRQGAIDPQKLFVFDNLDDAVKKITPDVEQTLEKLNHMRFWKKEPDAPLGSHCQPCSFRPHCWKTVPAHSIFNVCASKDANRLAKAQYELPPEKRRYDTGILRAGDVAKDAKKIEVVSHLSGQPHIDREALAAFVDRIQHPVYYLDYETIQTTVPLFDGAKPGQQVPFQFSLHIQESPDGPLTHHSFLHDRRDDPRADFVRELLAVCGDKGTVLVYNQAFESARNEEQAQFFPEHAAALRAINARMVDLYEPFRNHDAYFPAQNGSASIKAVLPVLTDLSYKDLDISKGDVAAYEYLSFMKGGKTPEQVEKMRVGLEKYCTLDTMAMVELLTAVKKLVAGWAPTVKAIPGHQPL